MTLVRSMGRGFARLAEWEVAELLRAVLAEAPDADRPQMKDFVAACMPVVEELHTYVWRRHLANAAGRMLPAPESARTACGWRSGSPTSSGSPGAAGR